MRQQRFTLIELGAVVTLSAIGLGVLIQPGIPPKYQEDFQQGRDASKGMASEIQARQMRSLCTGQLKMLGNAGALYEGDNEGNRPGPDPLKWKKGDGPGWDEELAIQMGACIDLAVDGVGDKTYSKKHGAAKTLAYYTCPADPAGKTADYVIRSYGLNLGSANMVANVNDGIAVTDHSIPVSKVESGAGTVNLLEYPIGSSFGVRQGNYSIGFTGGTAKLNDIVQWMAANPCHGAKPAKVNALMYDGHVEVLQAEMLTVHGNQIMKYIK
jgi:prepilin-type processing-associated H-X9-DG protein